MAYTKEQREAKAKLKAEESKGEVELTAKIKAEMEAKIRAEVEAKIKAEYEAKLTVDKPAKPESSKKLTPKTKIPLDTVVPCKSNVNGMLVYVSKRFNGYSYGWSEFGVIEYVEISELIAMRNSDKAFYINNWILFEDAEEYSAEEIYDFLGVSQYYSDFVKGENLEDLFVKTPDEIKAIIKPLSKGVKENIATKAKMKIDSGEFDSRNRIKALEEALDIELEPSF